MVKDCLTWGMIFRAPAEFATPARCRKEMNPSHFGTHLNSPEGLCEMIHRAWFPNRESKERALFCLTPAPHRLYLPSMTVIRQDMCICCCMVTRVSLAGETAT